MKKINLFRSFMLCMMIIICATTKAQSTVENNNLNFEETSIGYWGFDGMSNYGASWNRYGLRNSYGSELNIRSDFKRYSNYSVDVGINRILPFSTKDTNKLFVVGAIGPSLRWQKIPDVKFNATTGKTTENTKSKLFLDFFVSARVMYVPGKFRLSAGLFLWDAQFKFDSDFMNLGIAASIGYDL